MAYEKVKLLNTDSSVVAGAVSDINGFFSIPKLVMGSYILKIENQKYERAYKNIVMNAKTKIYDVKFELIKKENIKEFDEIKVSAESKTKRTQVGISELKLDQKSLERIPSYGAENDIVGAFSVTPGVVTTGDQGGQLYVRGGTPIQNKILPPYLDSKPPVKMLTFIQVVLSPSTAEEFLLLWILPIKTATVKSFQGKFQPHLS